MGLVQARASSARAELWVPSGATLLTSRSAVGLPVGGSGGGGLIFLSVWAPSYRHGDVDAVGAWIDNPFYDPY